MAYSQVGCQPPNVSAQTTFRVVALETQLWQREGGDNSANTITKPISMTFNGETVDRPMPFSRHFDGSY
jgi:hypothetical protein